MLRRPVHVTMLGLPGAGKTTLISGIYQCFEFGDAYGIKLTTDVQTRNHLLAIRQQLREGRFPNVTDPGQPGFQSAFTLNVRSRTRDCRIVNITYYDYAGEHLARIFTPSSGVPEIVQTLLTRVQHSDVISVLIDGFELWQLRAEPANEALRMKITKDLEILINLCSQSNRPVQLLLTKCDVFTIDQTPFSEVLETLASFDSYQKFVSSCRSADRMLRIIPVSAIGLGNVKLNQRPNGMGEEMQIRDGNQITPFQTGLPLASAVPAVLSDRIRRSWLLKFTSVLRLLSIRAEYHPRGDMTLSYDPRPGDALARSAREEKISNASVSSRRQAVRHIMTAFRREVAEMDGRFPMNQLSPAPTHLKAQGPHWW